MKNEIRQHRQIERMVGETKTNNLLNEIKHNCLKQNHIFRCDLNRWQLWHRLGLRGASWIGVLTCGSRPSGPWKPPWSNRFNSFSGKLWWKYQAGALLRVYKDVEETCEQMDKSYKNEWLMPEASQTKPENNPYVAHVASGQCLPLVQ